MARTRRRVALATAACIVIGAGVLALTMPRAGTIAAIPSQARAEGPGEEAEEEQEISLSRLEALAEAEAEGTLGRLGPVTRHPAPGWVGARVVHPRHDDWEPAVAADPRAPWVYVAVTRFGAPMCGRCPQSAIMIERSNDGGKTWSKARPVCRCEGTRWQADPILEVARATGSVYAVWLNGYNAVFSRSDDHGRTWSAPVSTQGGVAWNDKPALAVSANGNRVYVSWNGPSGGDLWIARSRDGGGTWEQRKVTESDRYYFAYNGLTAAGGTVAFSQSSLTYTGPDGKPAGPVLQHAIVSQDGGDTWTDVVVDSVRIGVPCTAEGCTSDYYTGHSSIGIDRDGSMTFVYDGAARPGKFQRVWTKTSTDGGLTWSDRFRLSSPTEQAGFPMVIARGGLTRMWYMQTRGRDLDAWNVWYRESEDAGITWTDRVRLSDVTSGFDYVTRKGFNEPYGDYGEIAVTNTGATFAVWGEGKSYLGPGGVWFNRQA